MAPRGPHVFTEESDLTRRPPVRAIVFDAGHTLLEMDDEKVAAFLWARGDDVGAGGAISRSGQSPGAA